MRPFFSAIFLFIFSMQVTAQAPPVIEWQKCFGGIGLEAAFTIRNTTDGGFITGAYTTSNDGDVSGNNGGLDIWILKLDAVGNIIWKTCLGGTKEDNITDLLQTKDGGYVVLGRSESNNGDVAGNYGSYDIWIIKLNATGSIVWQKNYGSPSNDGFRYGFICESPSDGYIVSTQVTGNGGDVSGFHAALDPRYNFDVWLFKIDLSGTLIWQKCIGGSLTDAPGALVPTADGCYIVSGHSTSIDGDITCRGGGESSLWLAKVDDAGTILWQKCLRTNAYVIDGKRTSDGGFIFTGTCAGRTSAVGDLYILKTDAAANIEWETQFGGTEYEIGSSIIETSDGNFVVCGSTSTRGEIICNFRGAFDLWLLNIDNTGKLVWQKTYGGSMPDNGFGIVQTADLGFVAVGMTTSDDGDVDLSIRRGYTDIWMVKFNFPGIEIIPEITISASETNICPGKKVTFIAECVDEGDAPNYQWEVNGSNVGTNSNTLILTTLSDGDVITCTLTSNQPCVTQRIVLSNSVTIRVDPTETPVNFLGIDTTICDYGKVSLKASGNYKTYSWSTGATTPILIINQPGKYWLDVTTNKDCPGVDTIIVTPKECLKGFFMPTAFSPNNDGKNDLLKPILGGKIKEYHFSIYNRWGQRIFETSDPDKGWDGKLNGQVLDGNVFVWTCRYQFEGGSLKTEKGTAVIIR